MGKQPPVPKIVLLEWTLSNLVLNEVYALWQDRAPRGSPGIRRQVAAMQDSYRGEEIGASHREVLLVSLASLRRAWDANIWTAISLS